MPGKNEAGLFLPLARSNMAVLAVAPAPRYTQSIGIAKYSLWILCVGGPGGACFFERRISTQTLYLNTPSSGRHRKVRKPSPVRHGGDHLDPTEEREEIAAGVRGACLEIWALVWGCILRVKLFLAGRKPGHEWMYTFFSLMSRAHFFTASKRMGLQLYR